LLGLKTEMAIAPTMPYVGYFLLNNRNRKKKSQYIIPKYLTRLFKERIFHYILSGDGSSNMIIRMKKQTDFRRGLFRKKNPATLGRILHLSKQSYNNTNLPERSTYLLPAKFNISPSFLEARSAMSSSMVCTVPPVFLARSRYWGFTGDLMPI